MTVGPEQDPLQGGWTSGEGSTESALFDPETQRWELASHWLREGRPDRALQELDRLGSVRGVPDHTLVLRSAALLLLRRFPEAAAAARRGLAVHPDHLDLLELLVAAEWALGNLAQAERALLRAIDVEPSAVLLARYAMLAAHAGQLDKAERLVEEARAEDLEEPLVTSAYTRVAYLKGDDREAAERARAALQLDPEDAVAHALMGSIALERGDVGSGARHLRTAANLRPGDHGLERDAEEVAVLRHPALAPLRLIGRFGAGKIWIAAIGGAFLLQASGLDVAAMVVAALYVVFAAYSWVAPPAVRRWLRRRNRDRSLPSSA